MTPAWVALCETPMRGFFGAETVCARYKGHGGEHYPSVRDLTSDMPPEIARLIAEAEERGAARVRERVEAVLRRLSLPAGARCNILVAIEVDR